MSTLLEQAELAADLLGAAAHENGRIVCTAESLTGGMVSELITSVAGSSAWFDRGYVTYQISGKEEMIDVPAEVIAEFGVVSEPVAEARLQPCGFVCRPYGGCRAVRRHCANAGRHGLYWVGRTRSFRSDRNKCAYHSRHR